MRVLGIDSAMGGCSAALLVDGRVVARRLERCVRGHAEVLLPLIEAVLRDASAGFGDVDRFGVTVGPGGFTGLRIGLATARGLALAARRPLVGVTTFEAIAHGLAPAARQGRRLAVLIESRRGDVFAQAFAADLSALGDPAALAPEAVASWLAALTGSGVVLVTGDAAGRLFAEGMPRDLGPAAAAISLDETDLPHAGAVARLAAERPAPAPGSRPPLPLYLRPPDARPPA